jgi:glucosamine 6-phosphate synthetase-like amidotransferase/phosphosugar isomerase protein
MGHTRLTTQGSEKLNQNNHPFRGKVDLPFALAHNGVLYNDRYLRSSLSLPHTSIETDSYVAVQLLEQQGALTSDSLKYMAEQVEGTFVFTVLDAKDNLYFVKGDNPLCLYHYPKAGFYLYASTEEILKKAIKRMRLPKEKPTRIPLVEGDIVQIDADGDMTTSTFSPPQSEYCLWGMQWNRYFGPKLHRISTPYGCTPDYVRDLKSVACAYGYSPEEIDELLETGFSLDEVEELLYCGEL